MKKATLTDLSVGGLYLGCSTDGKQIYFNSDDTHSLTIGATRCGKTRCTVLQSIALMALAGESIIASDPKGELYAYTSPFLRRQGYEVLALDFKYQDRGVRYNFLQPVLDAVAMEDLNLAVQSARNIAQMMVPDEAGKHTDPIWTDGQRAALTVGILAVCIHHTDMLHQSTANAYDFIAKMCEPQGKNGEIGLTYYLAKLPADDPLIHAMSIARIAPEKMRGSFYASALTTTSLFTDPLIHDMTSQTDFDHMATGDRKRAIFLILPDDQKTYYQIAALFVYEQYQMLVRRAEERGGRLARRVNFVLDEFGNFARINDFDTMITVGGGRGIRFHLFLQDTSQMYEKYGDKLGKTILSNCATWVYLFTQNTDTLKEISEKLGKYTVKSPTQSASTGGNVSASFSLTGRELLTSQEVGRLQRPWMLVLDNGSPVMAYAPDISKTVFNTLFGLGDREHNRRVMRYRLYDKRPPRALRISFWDGWKEYVNIARRS